MCYELSELYYELKPNNWIDEFLFYRILTFVYDIITSIDIALMPTFFYRRNLCYTGQWGKDDKIDEILDQLQISQNQIVWNKIFDYCFKVLPVQMNLPEVCLTEEGNASFMKSPNFGREYMKFKNEVDENGITRFDENGVEIRKHFTQFEIINESVKILLQEIVSK